MKVKNSGRIILIILVFYPLLVILIPRLFGYYLYGPFNSEGTVYLIWIILGIIWWNVRRKYPIESKIYLSIVVLSILWYFPLDFNGRIYSNMRKITPEDKLAQWRRTEESFGLEPKPFECGITYYGSSPVGGEGVFSLGSSGGGTFVDSNIPGYKRLPNKEEKDQIKDCSTSRAITPEGIKMIPSK